MEYLQILSPKGNTINNYLEFGLFVFGIEELNLPSILYQDLLLPCIDSSPNYFAYFTFKSISLRSEAMSKLTVSEKFLFDIDFVDCSLTDWKKNIKSSIMRLENLRKNWKSFTNDSKIRENSTCLTDKQIANIENLKKQSKKIARSVLSNLFFPIRQHLFLINRREKVNMVWNQDRYLVNIIFPILYFYLARLDSSEVSLILGIIPLINLEKLRKSFKLLKNNTKILISDLFFQALMLENEFIDVLKLLSSLKKTILSKQVKFKSLKCIHHLSLKEILLKGHQIILPTYDYTYYYWLVNKFINSIYIHHLPSVLSGVTLINSAVLIQSHGNLNANDDLTKGFILMTALHELAHFEQRVNLMSKKEWFCFRTQESYLDDLETEDTEDESWGSIDCFGINEGGSILIRKIFGYEPEVLYFNAAKYILNHENWVKSIKNFQKCFKELNKLDDAKAKYIKL